MFKNIFKYLFPISMIGEGEGGAGDAGAGDADAGDPGEVVHSEEEAD